MIDQTTKRPKGHVLIVEDNTINQFVMAQVLKKMGLDVGLATSGEACLTLVDQMSFDLILMDKRMPGMSGVEATLAIRNSGKPYAHTPIILCTADLMSNDKEAVMQSGISHLLGKPIAQDDLQECVRHFLQNPYEQMPESNLAFA